MAKVVKHPTFEGVTSETHPNLLNEDGKTWKTAESHPGLFKKDGTPRAYVDRAAAKANAAPRRSNEEMLKHYEDKLAKAKERHAKEIAGIEKKITYFKNGPTPRVVDPVKAAEAAKELLGKGMTPDQILAAAEQLRLAAAAVKGKSEEEIKAIAAPPPFLAVTAPQPALV